MQTLDGAAAHIADASPSAASPPVQEEKLVPAPWLGPEATLQLPGTQSGTDGGSAWSCPLSTDDDLDGFHAHHCAMRSSELKGVYSLSWYGRLLLAAGKGGVCSLFSIPEVYLTILCHCTSVLSSLLRCIRVLGFLCSMEL